MGIEQQIKDAIERAGTLKPIIGGGLLGGLLFGEETKKSDKIYFEAPERGVSKLTLLSKEYPDMGLCYQTFLFSAQGEPQNVEEAVKIAETLDKKQLDYYSLGISGKALRPTLSRLSSEKEYLEGAKAVDALFGRKWPEALFTMFDMYFDEKEAAKLVYNYVVWAVKDDVLHVLPLTDGKVKKVI
jgi:hypothetical protein